MTVKVEDVLTIARLARLGINDSDASDYTRQLGSILDFVAQMNRVDTSGVEPLAHPLELEARLRDDVISEDIDRDTLQANAPQTEDGLYLVPQVIE